MSDSDAEDDGIIPEEDDDLQITGEVPANRSTAAARSEVRFPALERLDEQVRERLDVEEQKREKRKLQHETHKVHGQILAEGLGNNSLKEAKAIVNKYVKVKGSTIVKGWVKPGTSAMQNRRAPGDLRRTVPTPGSTNPDASSGTKIRQCSVINCGMRFDSAEAYWDHVSRFEHSPCNPCLYIKNGTFTTTHTTHVCPACSTIYMNEYYCLEHMRITGHRNMMEPVYVTCYACPQCLMLFNSKDDTLDHMYKESHKSYTYAFADDSNRAVQPVPMPGTLPYAYMDACKQVSWSAECTTCQKTVASRTQAQPHIAQEHTVIATCDQTPADVFIQFLRGYTCVQCFRLFSKLPDDGLSAVHKCSADVLGMIVEYDCRSFIQFVCRLSLEPNADPNEPGFGPSRRQRDRALAAPRRRGSRGSRSPSGSPNNSPRARHRSGSGSPHQGQGQSGRSRPKRQPTATQSRPPDSRGSSEESMIPMSLFDDPVENEDISGANNTNSRSRALQSDRTSSTSKWRSPIAYNSDDSSNTVTPVLETSAEATPPPPSAKDSNEPCSSAAMTAEAQSKDTTNVPQTSLQNNDNSDVSNNSDDVSITKVEESPEKHQPAQDDKKGRQGKTRVKTRAEARNVIRVRDSRSSGSTEEVTHIDSDDDDVVVATMAGTHLRDKGGIQAIGSQSECVSRPTKRSHPREGATRTKRTRRNNGQIDEEEEERDNAMKKASSKTDMLWSDDDDDDDDVSLFSVLQGRKTTTAKRKKPSGNRTVDPPSSTTVASADSTTVDLSNSTVVDVSDTPTPTPTPNTRASLLPPRGGKTDAELEAEMMDRALKESLDAASTQDADAVDEQRILERALKESLATSKKTKVPEGMSEDEMLKAAIAESLRDSTVIVSDLEDGEIYDDDDDKNNNDTINKVTSNASALSNLGWSCVPATSATKTAGKSSTESQREKSSQDPSVTLTGSDAAFLDRRARNFAGTSDTSNIEKFLERGIKRGAATNHKRTTFIFGGGHGRHVRSKTSDRPRPSGNSSGRMFLGRGVSDNTKSGSRSQSSSPSGARDGGRSGGAVAPMDLGGGHISPLMALDKSLGRESSQQQGGPGGSRGGQERSSPVPGDPTFSRPGAVGLMRCPLTDAGDPEPEYLGTMKHIVFLDLDNWCGFFSRLSGPIPDKTFVWGFHGGNLDWKEPARLPAFVYTKDRGLFHLHSKCGRRKDAADFAICLTVGRMDGLLPKHIPFTILSGDHGFYEIESQMKNSERRTVVINPHHQTPDMVYTLIQSVADA